MDDPVDTVENEDVNKPLEKEENENPMSLKSKRNSASISTSRSFKKRAGSKKSHGSTRRGSVFSGGKSLGSQVASVESYMWRGYGHTLGDALDLQFVRKLTVSQASQTDWNWRKMAERWGHGKTMYPSDWKYPDHYYDPPETQYEKSKSSGGKTDVGEYSREKVMARAMSLEPTEAPRTLPHTDKKENTTQDKVHNISGVPIYDVKFCRPVDKCIDTTDLDFNPYDPRMLYTRIMSQVKPMYIPTEMQEVIAELGQVWSKTESFHDRIKASNSDQTAATTKKHLPRRKSSMKHKIIPKGEEAH